MSRLMIVFSGALVVSVAFCMAADAQVRMPRIFGDHMVLQRDKPVKIWGQATPGTEIRVSFADQDLASRTDSTGSWSVSLKPMAASFEGRDLVVQGGADDRVVLQDLLVGEVWICGGQSNMEWVLRASRDADIEIPSAEAPAIRFIRLPKTARSEPQIDFPPNGKREPAYPWKTCTADNVEGCTGVGYYFGLRLHRRLRVPVGLVDTSWGGTMAQHWASPATLGEIPAMKSYFDAFEKRLAEWRAGGGADGAEQRHKNALEQWEKDRALAEKDGRRAPGRPRLTQDPATTGHPGAMYNGIIQPLAPLAIRGVLFYQGENNSFGEAWKPFPRTFPAVIADWRAAFGQPDLPFGIIQIAGWSNRRSMTYDMNHHTNIVREIQHLTWDRTPNTGLIATYDTNSNQSIHPGRKLPVGERSARWALATVYGVKSWRGGPLEWQGPVYESMDVDGGKIIVSFKENTVRGLRLDQDAEQGFYVAGKDRVFHVARARVRKNIVEVWADTVPSPVAVRYGWSNLPLGSLMNARELPAYPFRSDDWPLVPHQSKGAYEVDRSRGEK